MKLIFKIKKSGGKNRNPVEIILKKGDKVYKRIEETDKLLEGLDKILKKSKVEINSIRKKIRIDNSSTKNKYTSFRIVKSIEKALKLF